MFILNIRQMMPATYLGKELCLEFGYPRPEVMADFLLNCRYYKEPTAAGMRFLRKKNGTLRMVHTFMHLNAATIISNYPMGRIDSILQELSQAFLEVMFIRDAANGYDDDRERSGKGLILSNRFVFGENDHGYFKKSACYSLSTQTTYVQTETDFSLSGI
jgi:hypothetical protein